MSEELITFEVRIFNEKDYYIDDVKVTKDLFYKIKNKCIEENKIIEENQQLKERIRILTEHPFISKLNKSIKIDKV